MAYIKDDWWHVDSKKRRIGWMWPEDMVAILSSYFGDNDWVLGFSKDQGLSTSAINRWKVGVTPIPKSVAYIINSYSGGSIAKKSQRVPVVEASWLPDAKGANGRTNATVQS